MSSRTENDCNKGTNASILQEVPFKSVYADLDW